ncbi:MAG: outer membrane lipoprotein-sorting protein [Candidatus Binatia bacterium]
MHTRLLTVVAVLPLLATLAGAAGAETAREILDRRRQLDDTTRRWEDRHQRMKFTIAGKGGGERERELELYERKDAGGEQKTIVFFQTPAEVKGTAFLSHSHKGRPAEQWLFLPELARTRQITANTRSQSFVGTDLSYHDLDLITEMTSWTEEDAASKLTGSEAVDGVTCYAIELTPRREDIGYRRILVWLGAQDLVPRRLEFFGAEEPPVKRIVQSDIKDVGAIPTAHHIHVETPAAGTHTEMAISDVRFDQHLDAELFTQRALERGAP